MLRKLFITFKKLEQMKKKLSFQKKIVANLNSDQMNNVNGGAATVGLCTTVLPRTRDRQCGFQTGGDWCISVYFCDGDPYQNAN